MLAIVSSREARDDRFLEKDLYALAQLGDEHRNAGHYGAPVLAAYPG